MFFVSTAFWHSGELFFSAGNHDGGPQGIIDGRAFQGVGRPEGTEGYDGRSGEAEEGAGHFQNERCPGKGDTHHGDEKSHHSIDDESLPVFGRDKAAGKQGLPAQGAEDSADAQHGHEYAAGHVAGIAEQGKGYLDEAEYEQKAQKGQRRAHEFVQVFHQMFTAAKHAGKGEGQHEGRQHGRQYAPFLGKGRVQSFEVLGSEQGFVIQHASSAHGYTHDGVEP